MFRYLKLLLILPLLGFSSGIGETEGFTFQRNAATFSTRADLGAGTHLVSTLTDSDDDDHHTLACLAAQSFVLGSFTTLLSAPAPAVKPSLRLHRLVHGERAPPFHS